jgi:hypothetical protein
MSAAQLFTSIQKVTFAYKQKLAQIPDENFEQSPRIGGWSYSEVYNHIFDLSVLSLNELNKCLSGQGQNKKTHWITRLILFFGRFPPAMKLKVPKKLASRVTKITKEEASDMINKFLVQMQPLGKTLEQANLLIKTPHPRLGFLNATQWLRFIEIHLKHHLKQLNRIDKSF